MKAFLFYYDSPASRLWMPYFRDAFRQRGIRMVRVANRKEAILRQLDRSFFRRVSPGDLFVGRPKCPVNNPWGITKEFYRQIASRFEGDRIFPPPHLYDYYDDKREQMALFQAKPYPYPKTIWVETREEIRRFMESNQLTFPVVRKDPWGAESSNVSLVNSIAEVRLPCLIQEFCRANKGDYRIMVIGHRILGYWRDNRESDFRASGSGLRVPADLPMELMELAYRFSRENGFPALATDFIRDNSGRWAMTEFAYTWPADCIYACARYYDARNQYEPVAIRPGQHFAHFIVEDLLS